MNAPDVDAVRRAGSEIVAALRGRLDPERFRTACPLAPFTTFKIGGPADALYDATTADDLAIAVTAARAAGIPFVLLGLGANILVGDRGVRGLVIRNASGRWRFSGTELTAESGAEMAPLIRDAVSRSLGGLEHYVGIPSTVGGALWQNLHFLSPAPARDRTMFIAEVVRSVTLLRPDGTRQVVSGNEMQFAYDVSRLHGSGEIALDATFALQPADRDALDRTMMENLSWRGARHPWLEHHPSAGSIFRKIDGVGAGRLIDECGLKGTRVGGALLSFLHANIIVNVGGATAADVRTLIARIQARVRERHGVDLVPEIGFVGEF